MKILLVNKFLYPKGGDAICSLETGELLVSKGHEVLFWGMKHPENPDYPYKELFVSHVDFNKSIRISQQLKTSINILYSFEARKKIEKLLKVEKPDIVHLNNFAHQISPSILDVFKKYNLPTVMTLHDYKLVCPSYSMLTDGKPCEKCRNGRYFWCLLKKCTKGSYVKSSLNVVEMYLHHKILHIYDKINVFISPSVFLKEKIREMGFKGKVIYLPNFVKLEDFKPSYDYKEKFIIYFGRLSQEKGLFTLIEGVKGIDIKLKIIGDGPLRKELESKAREDRLDNIFFTGYKKGKELKEEIWKSIFVVLPSEWYENNPRTVMEAFALGKPVIGARIGGVPELVRDGETGLTFEPRNAEDLRDKIDYLKNSPDKISEMGKNARKFAEKELNPEKHYQQLMKIYQMAIDKHS